MRNRTLLTVACFLGAACSAYADDLVQLNGTDQPFGNGVQIRFTVPDPVTDLPGDPYFGGFTLSDIDVFVNGQLAPGYSTVTFFTLEGDGGFIITNDAGAFLLSQAGLSLYTSSAEGPTFIQGETDLFADDGAGTPEHPIKYYGDFSAYITPVPAAATPEPSSFALLGTGLLGVAGVVKRRFA